MEFTIKSGSPEKQRSACVVVGVFDNRKLSLSAELIDRASNGYISEIIRRGDMEGKLGSTLLLHNVKGTLADRVLLSRSGLTRLVDRLQAEGFVRREPSPDDARGTFTVLTQNGFNALRTAAPVHLAGVRDHWLAHYTDDELRLLGGLLERLAPQ